MTTAIGALLIPALTALAQAPAQAPVPMMPRPADWRVPYLQSGPYIQRRRLEKRDPAAAVSDVVRPIVYVLDPETPKQWVPWVRRGVEAWNPVFEALGFRGALVVRAAVRPDEVIDPGVTPILWETTDPEQDFGIGGETFNDADPATGEITRSTIHMYDAVATPPYQRRLALRLAPLDPALPFPLPDSIVGRLLQVMVAHEVGHSLGLDHNFAAAVAYPVDSLRHLAFVRRWGHTASIMSYTLVNTVAQPDDRVPFADRVARVGAYDRWALAWGYLPVPGAATPEAERPTLEARRAPQDTAAYLRVPVPGVENQFGLLPNVLGDDPVRALEYTTSNLARAAVWIDAQHALPPDERDKLRAELAVQWAQRVLDGAVLVGAVETSPPYPADRGALTAEPVAAPRQRAVLRAVLTHALYGRDPLVRYLTGQAASADTAAAVTVLDSGTIRVGWAAEPWREAQQRVLAALGERIADLATTAPGREPEPGRLTALEAVCAEWRTLDQASDPTSTGGAPPRDGRRRALRSVTTETTQLCAQHEGPGAPAVK